MRGIFNENERGKEPKRDCRSRFSILGQPPGIDLSGDQLFTGLTITAFSALIQFNGNIQFSFIKIRP